MFIYEEPIIELLDMVDDDIICESGGLVDGGWDDGGWM